MLVRVSSCTGNGRPTSSTAPRALTRRELVDRLFSGTQHRPTAKYKIRLELTMRVGLLGVIPANYIWDEDWNRQC